MKVPIKPKRPTKPYAPNKNLTAYRHELDIANLLFKKKFYIYVNDVEVEISEDEYDYSNGYSHSENLEPSLQDIVNLVPKNIPLDKIHFSLNVSNSEGANYLNDVSLYYETPYDYDAEYKKYQDALKIFEKDAKEYKEILHPNYVKDCEIYRKEKASADILRKKEELEQKLKEINKKVEGK